MTAFLALASVDGMPWTYWLGVAVTILTGLALVWLVVEYYRRVVPVEREVKHWYQRARTS